MKWAQISAYLVLTLMAALALLTLLLAPDPHAQDLGASLLGPHAQHWLGTDHLGRDLLARLGEGLRTSLGLALASASLAVTLGAALGLLAAARPGWNDRLLGIAADGVSSIPGLLWVLLIAALAPGQKWALYSGLVLTAWVEFFRMVRAHARSALLSQPVQAAGLLGFGPAYIYRWHVLQPIAGVLARLWAYAVATAVLAIAALGFISVGVRPPQAELGLMMTEALPYYFEAPWLLAAPVLALVLLIAALQAIVGHAADDKRTGVPA
jgi:peptide/nickel transport system permease protein